MVLIGPARVDALTSAVCQGPLASHEQRQHHPNQRYNLDVRSVQAVQRRRHEPHGNLQETGRRDGGHVKRRSGKEVKGLRRRDTRHKDVKARGGEETGGFQERRGGLKTLHAEDLGCAHASLALRQDTGTGSPTRTCWSYEGTRWLGMRRTG